MLELKGNIISYHDRGTLAVIEYYDNGMSIDFNRYLITKKDVLDLVEILKQIEKAM